MAKAKIYEQKIIIPTYETGKTERNPMFFEKRVYQGSSGKVYPNPVIEKISDEKTDKEYNVVILENDYIYVVVMPELGGRIYTAYDKTNNYDFVYHNEVIKPALVGLLGPWISGGIEFNWPQHHRPSTYMPTSYKICENADGSVSVFVGEIENMFGTKGMTEIKIYADRSYIEINAQIYNRTSLPQTFLWWANPAVRVNNDTRTVMPPDVTAVMDHGKRAVSAFPIARGEYYKMDYSAGVDISMYKNIPVPTSFMAHKSNFDFVGGYDAGREAGIYHYADHRISPGKKQWTWGCGDFGKAWDRNLTDENDPYVELMTGCFTDNQPDFTFLAPQEEKTFTQYFMPYKRVGQILNANKEFCLSYADGVLKIYATGEYPAATVTVSDGGKTVVNERYDFTPNTEYKRQISVGESARFTVIYGGEILTFSYDDVEKFDIPAPAKACPEPKDCATTEELYLFGTHIEQYRHATRLAEDYYLEGLSRDPSDLRLNNAYGLLLLRRGLFQQSTEYFKRAIEKATVKNPNPSNTEPFFNLGTALLYLGRYDQAYDNFYKCVWTNENKSAAYYYLALIDKRREENARALTHVNNSLIYSAHNMKAHNLKTALLLREGLMKEAAVSCENTQKIDPLDVLSAFYAAKIGGNSANFSYNRLNATEIIDLTYELICGGDYIDAINFADGYLRVNPDCSLLWYYKIYAENVAGLSCWQSFKGAASANDWDIFAHRLSDIVILNKIIEVSPSEYRAYYQLGNLFYDKKQYETAHGYWNKAVECNPSFPTAYRNLALYYYNKARDAVTAAEYLEKAFALDKTDSRIYMELDQLRKINGMSDKQRYADMQANLPIVEARDDQYLEYLSLMNECGDIFETEKLIAARRFHPWEGGEGKASALYKSNKIKIALDMQKNGGNSIEKLKEALIRPYNLGEGKLIMDYDNDVYYHLGLAYEKAGNAELAKESYSLAVRGAQTVAENMFYNDSPIEYQYYMALSFAKVGDKAAAKRIADGFIRYCEVNYDKKSVIDYFAVSLPDMLIWERDMDEKNRTFCEYVRSLGEEIIAVID